MKWWESRVSQNKPKKLLQGVSPPVIVNSRLEINPVTAGDVGSPCQPPQKPPTKQGSPTMSENTPVTMEDGSQEVFGGKKKMIKDTKLVDGNIITTLKFGNGRVITFAMPDEMRDRFAMHGADQKLGDCIAGIKDVDDCILEVEKLITNLEKGDWSQKREGGGMGGTSVLLRALIESKGEAADPEKIKAWLQTKTQAEKVALRQNPRLKPFIERIEAEKQSKSNGVDTDALLDELGD